MDNVRVNRATSKGLNLRVERMVKWRSHHPRNEPTPTRDVASVQRFVIRRPTISLHILASLPNKVEVVRAWPEFGVSMSGAVRACRHGQANRWLFRTVYRCLLPWSRHGRSGSEYVASAFERFASMPDHVVALDSRRDNGNVHGPRRKSLNPKAARPAAPCATYCYPDGA